MLSIGKLAAGPSAGRYYVDQVARGREDYYDGEGEAPGRWAGSGAELLGLRDEVTEGGIGRLLEARDPGSGETLRRPPASGAVAGFDLTFRAPKSVSILVGVADAATSAQVREAHEHAVGEALAYLEREACRARRGRGGVHQVTGAGFVAAAFRHRSSRAGDPLLHTHVVVANGTRGPDGRWTALDGRPLYRHAKTAGYLYQAALRAELGQRLGVEWNRVENGAADIRGVPREVIAHFSRRRAEIVDYMRSRGEYSARAAQIATLETRRGKAYGAPADRLRDEWRARAAEHGLDERRLGRVIDNNRPGRSAEASDPAERLLGHEGLTHHRATFTRADALQALAEEARDGAPVAAIEARADQLLADARIVEVDAERGQQRFTTRDMAEIERGLLDDAGQHASRSDIALADAAHVEAAVAIRPTLSDEQHALIDSLTRGGHGVRVVQAAAGTGKTFALDAARDAWQRSGVPVVGCALSARAACELRDQGGMHATTIARLKHGLDEGVGLAHGSVLIIDEAGMVGTRDLAALTDAASASDAKLVLVGDDRQLPEIAAGGAFRALAGRIGSDTLEELRRQRHDWDRAALAALRDGDVESFARTYQQRGRIVATTSAEDARAALVGDWWAAHRGGDDALMIAHRRSDVADLNARAREHLRADGRLGADETIGRATVLAVGDRVVTTRNDARHELVNGQAGTVLAITDAHLTVDLDGRGTTAIPRDYAERGHVEHAYALTAHRAQGATFDRTFVLGSDELYREWGYTALSRHRDETRFYVSAASRALNVAPAPLVAADQVAGRAAELLTGSRQQQLATQGLTDELRAARLAGKLTDARADLERAQSWVDSLEEQRRGTSRFRRDERARLASARDDHAAGAERCAASVARLEDELAAHTAPDKARLQRAIDPLATAEPAARDRDRELERPPAPQLDRGRDPHPAPDLGVDL